MMINTPSAPGGAAAAPSALPGVAMGDAAFAATPAPAEGVSATPVDSAGLPALFAQLLDVAGLAASPEGAAAPAEAGQATGEAIDTAAADEEALADLPLAAMMTALPFVALPTVRTPFTAAPAAAGDKAQAASLAGQARGVMSATPIAPDSARQAAANAITAALPLAARLRQDALPASGEPLAPQAGEARPGALATTTATGTATTAVLAAQDGAAQSGQDGQPSQGDGQATFRGVMAATAPAPGAGAPADTVKLAGTPEQWQQPLRAALGDRLQVTLQKGGDGAVNQAVIRLEPPNLGSIEISIRQSAGALHVSLSATHGEVVRQLNAVGDSMRQDLSQRQPGDVAVTVSQASSRSLADSEGRGRQPERDAEQQREQRGPGRALNEGDVNNTTFAMLRE